MLEGTEIMTIIEDIKAKLEDIHIGRFGSSTVHELADLTHKLIDSIEGKHGNRDQAVSQGAVAQETGRAAGPADPVRKISEGEKEPVASAPEGSELRG